MTLYEIDSRLLDLLEQVDPETGELLADPEEWASLQMERDQKIENTALFIKNLRADAEAIKAEEQALAKRRKRLEKKAEWLRMNLQNSLAGQPFETSRCAVKFKRNPESVSFSDPDAAMSWAIEYAQDCVRYAPPELSKAAIKARLKDGEAIPGAELIRETRMEVS